MNEKKVMVVDDDGYQRRIIKKYLTRLGYSVTTMKSAEEALTRIKKEAFPVIITDLIMLNMDGVELCERIREINSDSLVYSLSGYQNLYSKQRLKNAGFNGHLEKPLNIEKLEDILARSFLQCSNP